MILGLDAWVLWLASAIILLIIEATTISLVPIWFACGSILAVILDWFGYPVAVQLAAMVVVSTVLLVMFMSFVRPRLHQETGNAIPSNDFLGQEATVVDRIDPAHGTGLIEVCGQTWSASSESGLVIEPDARVRVLAIRGLKAIVEPIAAESPSEHARPEAR